MILADANESPDYDRMINQAGIETQRGNYNQTPGSPLVWPDFTVISGETLVGLNHKQAVEAMADLDKVEDQLWRELATTPQLVLGVEGFLCPHPEGTFAGNLTRVEHKTGRGGNEYDELLSRGRVIRQPFTRWVSFVLKCQDKGIPVVMTGDARGTVNLLVRLHANPANNLFERLIPVRQAIAETDWELREFAETLMGVRGARWGEEMAVAAGTWLKRSHLPLTVKALMDSQSDIHIMPLRSGRRIGPAAAKRLIGVLGW